MTNVPDALVAVICCSEDERAPQEIAFTTMAKLRENSSTRLTDETTNFRNTGNQTLLFDHPKDGTNSAWVLKFDDIFLSKQLPRNRRAERIAEACDKDRLFFFQGDLALQLTISAANPATGKVLCNMCEADVRVSDIAYLERGQAPPDVTPERCPRHRVAYATSLNRKRLRE